MSCQRQWWSHVKSYHKTSGSGTWVANSPSNHWSHQVHPVAKFPNFMYAHLRRRWFFVFVLIPVVPVCICYSSLIFWVRGRQKVYLLSSRLRSLMKDDSQQKLRSQGQQICCLFFRPTSKKSLGFLSSHIMVSIPWYDMLLCRMDHPPRRNRKKHYESLANQSKAIISNSFFGDFSVTCRARFLWSLCPELICVARWRRRSQPMQLRQANWKKLR